MALTDGNQVFGWAGRGVDGRVQAVFLTRPGPTTFAFSPRVEYDEGGRPSRTWSQQRSADGSLVVDLGADADPVVAVRAVGPGAFTVPEVVRVAPSATRASPTSALRVSPVVVRGSGDRSDAGPERRLLDRALRAGVGNLADLQASRLRVLWSGAPWKQRRLALVLVTRPDGVRLHALVGEYRGSEFTAGVRALPTADPDEVPFLLEPFSPEDPTYLLCPTGAGSVVYRRTGNPDRRLTVSETGALALIPPGPSPPTARGAEVSVHDPAGRHLLTARLPRQGTDDPLALFDPPS